MIVALSVLGVIAMMAVPMLNMPARAWHEAAVRRDLAAELRLAHLRLDDELRRALPGSVRHRQTGARHWLEMLIVRASARVRIGPAAGGPVCPLACIVPGNNDSLELACVESCFTTLGPWVGDPVQPGKDWLVVDPRRPGAAGDPYFGGNAVVAGGIKSPIVAVAPAVGGTRVDIVPHAFATLASSRRVWAVAEPVSYECDPGHAGLLRHSGYAIAAAQPTSFAGATTVAVAGDIAACTFVVASDPLHPPRQQVGVRMQVGRAAGAGAESLESLWEWTLREP